jgi:hypothetical protein
MTFARPDDASEPSIDSDGSLVPVVLELARSDASLVIDVADDPGYRGLEPQVPDGPSGGVVLLAYRHDEPESAPEASASFATTAEA